MQKIKISGLVLLVLTTVFADPALAAHPDRPSEIENLAQRLDALETRDNAGGAVPERAPFMLDALGRRLTFSGALEIEANYEKSKGEESQSDLTLATAELSVEAELNTSIIGHLVLLYEQEPDDDNLQIDEAVLSLRYPQPLLGITPGLHAGRQYLPTGRFSSYMISTPFTAEIGETRATAALLELKSDYATLKGGVFNGTADTGRDTVDSIVAAVEFAPVEGLAFGATWLSDLAESSAGLVADTALYHDRVPAGSAFVSLAFGPVSLEAEALAALEEFETALVGLDVDGDGEPDTDLTGHRPRTWNLEAAVQPVEALQVVGRYEEVRDFADDARRYGGTVSWGVFDQTVLALEYLYTNHDSAQADSQAVTAQLAMAF